jgi:transposase
MVVALPNTEFHQLVPMLREKNFYEPEELRPINWSAYTQAQIDDVKNMLRFIREKVDETHYLSVPGKVGRPLTDPKILAKAILLAEFLGSPERPAEGWISVLGPAVGIFQELDDRVIGEAYDHPEVLHILKQVFEKNKNSDRRLSADGTGLESSRKQNYETMKKTDTSLTSIVDSREIVQAFDASGEHERSALHKLINLVDGDSLRADAGFIDRDLVNKIVELGMKPYIFPKKNTLLNGSLAWKNMYLELLYDVMTWLTEYHQRSHTESFHSSFKRRNPIIRKRRNIAKLNQITARIIIHNQRRLNYFSQSEN